MIAPRPRRERREAVRVRVRVPATSANLGSAFDCAGLALQLHNEVMLELGDRDAVDVEGEGSGELGLGPDNLVVASARRLFEATGTPTPRLRVRMRNAIPLGRGLGSSSAAIVAGLVGANALLGSPCSEKDLLRHAVEIEGHGDNVAAALYGGLTLYVAGDGGGTPVRLPVPASLQAVVYIPDQRVPTKAARAALPTSVPRADALFNVARSALLVAALGCGRLDALRTAMEDRLHQPYRASLFPAAGALVEAALDAGALGSAVSGAGPTILALVREDTRGPVLEALDRCARGRGLAGRSLATGIARKGATIVRASGSSRIDSLRVTIARKPAASGWRARDAQAGSGERA